jgi:raffinose/stachyose/melibiose transport system permease protein
MAHADTAGTEIERPRPERPGPLGGLVAGGRVRRRPPATEQRLRAAATRRAWGAGKYVVLTVFGVVSLFPVVLILSTALKDSVDVRTDPFSLFSSVTPSNVAQAWTLGHFGTYFLNTVIITVPTVVATVVLSTMAGYAFARCRFPGRRAMFYLLLFGLLIPFFTIMIPLYYQLRQMGLLNTYLAVIIPLVAGANGGGASAGLPFGVFMMRSFFMDLPEELAHAARVDGCTEFQVFRRVMLPLVKPAAAALGIFTFLQSWNNFLVPLLYVPSGDQRPLATGLYLFSSGRTAEIGLLAAGTLIMVIPVVLVFALAQRQLVRGFTAGAMKG